MSSLYKGLSAPDYTDSADAPVAFKQFIDSGPLPRFANATARNNAIAAPVKGMACYRLDTGVVELYNGSNWLSVNPLVPPAHTHPGGDIHNETILGGKIADNTIPVSGSQDKLTGVVANGHLPNASEDGQGIVELTAAVTSTSKVLGLSARAATFLMPKTGGVFSGSVTVSAGVLKAPAGNLTSPGLQIGAGGEGIFSDTSNALEFKAGSSSFRFSGNGLAMLPGNDNTLSLGGSDYRFKQVWAVDGSINTSDPTKKIIEGRVGGGILKVIQDVMPIRYRWIDGDDGNHYGFDASEVQAVIPEVVKGEPGSLGIRERDLIAILWAAVRELDRRTAHGTA